MLTGSSALEAQSRKKRTSTSRSKTETLWNGNFPTAAFIKKYIKEYGSDKLETELRDHGYTGEMYEEWNNPSEDCNISQVFSSSGEAELRIEIQDKQKRAKLLDDLKKFRPRFYKQVYIRGNEIFIDF